MINSGEIYKLETIEHEGKEYPVLDADIEESHAVLTVEEGKIYVELIGYSSWFGDFAEWGKTEMT